MSEWNCQLYVESSSEHGQHLSSTLSNSPLEARAPHLHILHTRHDGGYVFLQQQNEY